jgi:hypothetical protein
MLVGWVSRLWCNAIFSLLGWVARRQLGRLNVREDRLDSPDIGESGREVCGDGAAEEVDLFECGHVVRVVVFRRLFFSCCGGLNDGIDFSGVSWASVVKVGRVEEFLWRRL